MSANYSFRKSVFEKTQYWELGDQYMVRREEGLRDIRISYSNVQSIRLSFLPNNRYRPNNYCCEIEAGQDSLEFYSCSYQGIGDFSNDAATYVPFVKEMVQRVKTVNPSCTIYAGQKPVAYYGSLIFTIVVVIALFLMFYYLPVPMGMGIVIKLLLIGYLGVYLVKSFRVNKPAEIASTEIPADVLPEIPREPDGEA